MDARQVVGPEPARPRAVERWREEVAAGRRTNNAADFDDLAAAAANEAAGLEELARGRPHEAQWFFDRAFLRLHGCFYNPDDGSEKEPGPGRLMLRKLKAGQNESRAGDPAPASARSNPWEGIRPTPAPTWASA